MKRVACPHCGFQNFEISAYCGRCERPLPAKKKKKAGPPPTPPPVEPPSQPLEPVRSVQPASAAPEAARLTVPPPIPPREDLSPMPIETSELMRAQEEAVYRKAEVRAATENLPEAAEPEPEFDAIDVIEAADALDLQDDHPGEIEVPVELASGWQVASARIIDAIIIVAAGAGVAWLETLLFATPWHTRNAYTIDIIADWVHAHPGPTLHGAIATLALGICYHLMAGRRGGRTLGRSLTGTVLVRASGRALTWPFLVTRMILSLVSLGLFGAGYFWAFIDSRHRTWHDLIMGTVVVRRRVRLRATPR